MKRTHRALWAAGWAGVAIGAGLAILGLVTGGELASLYGGYGLMMAAAAAYLLAGLGLREVFARRAQRPGTATGARFGSAQSGPHGS